MKTSKRIRYCPDIWSASKSWHSQVIDVTEENEDAAGSINDRDGQEEEQEGEAVREENVVNLFFVLPHFRNQ